MSGRKFFGIAITVTLLVTLVHQARSQSKPQSSNASKGSTGEGQVQQITLPQYPPQIPPGPNLEVYRKYCLTCHTARYISMQPRFPKTVWQSEVKKMVDAYGAQIPDTDQALIVEYLVAVRGSEAATNTPAK